MPLYYVELNEMNKTRHKADVILINTVGNGSTGRIMHDIQCEAINHGLTALAIVGRRRPYKDIPCLKVGNLLSFWIHVFVTTLTDRHGWGSYFHTKRIIKVVKKNNPRVIHLHNVHGYYINIPLLFKYLSNEYTGKIIWTLHDCWPITGHCPHFVIANCNRWKEGCFECPNKGIYPISLGVDASKYNYQDKKRLFGALKEIDIVVPSEWMAGRIRESFLNKYSISVINNGIDLATFDYKRYKNANVIIKNKYDIPGRKKIVLGVANIWDERKGLAVFKMLATAIASDYYIIVVGVKRGQIGSGYSNIIGIERTENIEELVQIYSAATVLINPSIEESFSLVTIEAMACGTPVIGVQGSAVAELITENSGVIASGTDKENMVDALKKIDSFSFTRKEVRESVINYSTKNMTKEYYELYEGQ